MASNQQHILENKKKFQQLCAQVRAAEPIAEQAWEWLCSIYQSHKEQLEHDRYWSACGLYVAGIIKHSDTVTPVPLTLILRATDISLVDLFEPLKDFVTILRMGEEANKKVCELQRRHINCSLLYKKYIALFEDMIHIPVDRLLQGRLFKIGWILYLVAKESIVTYGTDLLSEFNVLVACCALIYSNVHPSMRRPLQSRVTSKVAANVELNEVEVIEDLCDMNVARPSEVTELYQKDLVPLIINMCNEGSLKCTKVYGEKWNFRTLFDSNHLEENVAAFDVQYSCIDEERAKDPAKAATHLDERQLLIPVNCIGSPSRLGQKVRSYYNYAHPTPATPRARPSVDAVASPRVIPSGMLQEQGETRVGPSSQPVGFNETFQSVSWLRGSVGQNPRPSKTLLDFFAIADRNRAKTSQENEPAHSLEDEIMERCRTLCAKVDFGLPGAERMDEAISVYMKMLENLLLAEERRLHTNDFSSLLRLDVFHRSLIACAVEIVSFCYKLDMNSMTALDTFQVKPFEMIKIIESIVRHTKDLPDSVIRHFNDMEQVILQERAWNSTSTVFQLLSPEEQRHLGETVLSSTAKSTAATPMSPLQRSTRPRPGNVRSSSLELFYRKIMVLAAQRTRQLCLQLRIPTLILSQVWAAYSNILLWRPKLVMDRHLDQIMICTLYGICRANRYPMTFQTIIGSYRKQPQAVASTWRDVLLGDDNRGNIIQFYNKTFIRELEAYLLKFKADGSGAEDNTPVSIPVSPLKIPVSPIQVEPRHNLYMSPISGQRHQLYSTSPIMTHSMGFSPAKNLTAINKKLTKRRALFRDDESPAGKRQKVAEEPTDKEVDKDVQEGSHDLATLASLSGLEQLAASPPPPRRPARRTATRQAVKPKPALAQLQAVAHEESPPPAKKRGSARTSGAASPKPTSARKSPRQPKPKCMDEG